MKDFVASIDTPGGHMIFCAFLVGMCFAVLAVVDPAKLASFAGDVGLIALGGLGVAMKGQNGAKVSVQPKQDEPPKS